MTHDDQLTLRIDPLTDSVDGVARAVERLGARGIGERLARAVAGRYGRATLDVLTADNAVERVSREVAGMGRQRAEALHSVAVRLLGPKAKGRRERVRQLQHDAFMGRLGLTGFIERAIREHFGDKATADTVEAEIRRDPWQLTDVDGVGFLRADRVAMLLGCKRDDPRRLREGVLFQLQHQTEQDGHCYLVRQSLIHTTALMLQQPDDAVSATLDMLIRERRAIEDGQLSTLNSQLSARLCRLQQARTRIYPPSLYRAERDTARHLRRIMFSTAEPPSARRKREKRTTDYTDYTDWDGTYDEPF